MSTVRTRNLVGYSTVATKEIRRFMRIWQQTLLPPAITMSLYLLIFGNLIGSRIGEMAGPRDMDYIAPGIIMMAVITNAYSNVVSSFYGARFQRFVEEMLVSPMPSYVLVAGYITGGVLRGLLVGLIVTCVAATIADLRITHLGITVAVVLMTATLFSCAGFVNAIFARTFDDVSIVPTFVLTPLTYLGGVFYSIDLLPDFWRALSLFNPVLYMVNAFRYGILGVSDISVGIALAIITAFIVVLMTMCVWLIERGVGIRT